MADVEPPDRAWTDIGGSGPLLVFTHANGFPPGTYRRLLDAVCPTFQVATYAGRPLWSDGDPAELESWDPLAADFAHAIEDHAKSPVVAVGHSLGGVLCALAAARDPGLVSALVLLDPVVFSGLRGVSLGLAKRIGLGERSPLAVGARKRRNWWPDRSSAVASWSEKAVFDSWDPRVMADYLEAGLEDLPDGSVMLRYPKAWEARIYEICPHDLWSTLRRVEPPVLIVRGKTSDTLTRAAALKMERKMPDARLVEVGGTSHFLPMEKPDEVARLIIEFIADGEDRRLGCG